MERLKRLNILFLEDNKEFAKNTVETLSLYFNKVFHCSSVKEAIFHFSNFKIDVIISDIKVEGGNGLDFVKNVRQTDKQTPIVIISAHKDTDFLFTAIPLNILSYELKPLRYTHLLLLLKKISEQFNPKNLENLCENIEYSHKNKEVYKNNHAISLTKKEILFIELLLKNRDGIVTYEMLQRDIYQTKEIGDGVFKNLIFRLRKKIDVDFIRTINNLGYKLSQTHKK